MSTALAASTLVLPTRTPGQGTPGQAPGDAGTLFALLLGGILPITPGSPGGQPPAGQGGQVAVPSPRLTSPPLTPFLEASSDAGPSTKAGAAQADPPRHAVPAGMPPPPPEQAAPLVTPPETPGGSSGPAEARPILEAPLSPLPPLRSAGLSGTASPVDADGQTVPAIETAPRARPGSGRFSLSAVAPEGALDADGAVPTASPKATLASRPSALASGRPDSIPEPVGPSAPTADPTVGRSDPDRSQTPSLRPARIQLRAQAPIGPAAGAQLDRISQAGDHSAGDGRGVASIDGVDLPAGRPERASFDLPALPARTPVATPALQIAHQIVRAAHQRVERMVVQLEPAQLGRVEVRLDFGHDGRMSALIATDRAEALDLLQRDARALERSLEQAGLRLDSGGLSFALKRDGGHGQASYGAPGSELPGDPGSPKGGADQDAQHGPPVMLTLRLLDLQV
jgi:hypothetical protein